MIPLVTPLSSQVTSLFMTHLDDHFLSFPLVTKNSSVIIYIIQIFHCTDLNIGSSSQIWFHGLLYSDYCGNILRKLVSTTTVNWKKKNQSHSFNF